MFFEAFGELQFLKTKFGNWENIEQIKQWEHNQFTSFIFEILPLCLGILRLVE